MSLQYARIASYTLAAYFIAVDRTWTRASSYGMIRPFIRSRRGLAMGATLPEASVGRQGTEGGARRVGAAVGPPDSGARPARPRTVRGRTIR